MHHFLSADNKFFIENINLNSTSHTLETALLIVHNWLIMH